MKRRLSVSMMCVDFGNLNEVLRIFHEEKVNYLHIDVMDGHFVPNIMLGVSYVSWLRTASDIPLDIHLMVEEPIPKLSWFPLKSGDIVTVHVESVWNDVKELACIRETGVKVMLAVSPQTPVSAVLHLLKYVDGICVMLVVPGFSGQMMIDGMLEKVRELSRYREKNGVSFLIEVDGHVSEKNVRALEDAGAEIFVAGTSLLGSEPKHYREKLRLFYNA